MTRSGAIECLVWKRSCLSLQSRQPVRQLCTGAGFQTSQRRHLSWCGADIGWASLLIRSAANPELLDNKAGSSRGQLRFIRCRPGWRPIQSQPAGCIGEEVKPVPMASAKPGSALGYSRSRSSEMPSVSSNAVYRAATMFPVLRLEPENGNQGPAILSVVDHMSPERSWR